MVEKINECLAEKSVFALLIVKTTGGETVLRPIGGSYGAGINDAIGEMLEKHPGCKMKMFEENYNDYFDYFKPMGMTKEQLI
jgi:hypothetical protein